MNSIRFQTETAITALTLFSIGAQGGFPGILCPATDGGISLIDCTFDCKVGHNAQFGRCGPNFNCFCSLPRETVNILGTQCLHEAAAEIFEEACQIDCQCIHGALGGHCDFERHGCTCTGHAETFRSLCPFGSAEEYMSWSKLSNAPVNLGASPW